MEHYDLIVIGAGPAGEKAAVKAAYFGYKVAIVEKASKVGGAGINTGTLPSKTLKETAIYYSGRADQGLYGADRTLERKASVKDFMYRKNHVTLSESKAMSNNLQRHNVNIYWGEAKFEDPHTISICGEMEQKIKGDNILIATGSAPYHPDNIPFDGKRIHDSDSILDLERMPESLCIVGAGVIGCEYATIFATMGVKVYLVNHSDKILTFLDEEISNALISEMKESGVEILFNMGIKEVVAAEHDDEPLHVHLETNDELTLNVDMFLFAAGRQAATRNLNCEKVGIKIGKRGVVDVNERYQSTLPHVYAVGDVIGFPALASTSMDQGRVAVANIFDLGDIQQLAPVFPYGIYTIPEVSTVGMTEEVAKKDGVDYCVGRAAYKDMPRGKIKGCKTGFIKLVFNREDLVITGVHIIGEIASELIHYGVTLVENRKTLHQVISSVYNYPTLHDLYKYACYDGLGNLTGHKIREPAIAEDRD